uniref:Uncharacterized protein n=1 Tax=Ditylenchus dipsaci TaxID=166011 RepID=A0A915D8S0_9BILA
MVSTLSINMKEADSIHKHKMEAMEMTAVGGSQEVPSNQKSLLSKDKTTEHVSGRIGSKIKSLNPANDGKKEAGSKVAHVKELPGSKKKKRRSAANDMDNCSLEKE